MLKNILPLSFFFIISITFILAKDIVDNIDLKQIKPLKPNLKNKTKKDYEKKEDILIQPIKKSADINSKKKDDLDFNGSVDLDKDTREVNKVKINLNSNF